MQYILRPSADLLYPFLRLAVHWLNSFAMCSCSQSLYCLDNFLAKLCRFAIFFQASLAPRHTTSIQLCSRSVFPQAFSTYCLPAIPCALHNSALPKSGLLFITLSFVHHQLQCRFLSIRFFAAIWRKILLEATMSFLLMLIFDIWGDAYTLFL